MGVGLNVDFLETARAGGITRIAKYDVTAVLGRGGMGVVYRALDKSLGREVAIKTLTGGFADDPSMLARFYEEGKSMGRLNHPNIVAVYDIGVDNQLPYIVMECVSGAPLDKRMVAGEPMPMSDRLRIVEDVCSALGYAHQKGVIHRDVKPANIFVQPDGNAKLLDFGIARLSERDSGLTRSGLIIGTGAYMAPERIRGETIDGRSDIFAAGVVLYQLITGHLPFTGSDFAQLQKIVSEPAPPLNSSGETYPASLQTIVDRALAKSLEDRYSTAQEMAVDLSIVIAGLSQGHIQELLPEAERLMREQQFIRARSVLYQILRVDAKHAEARKLLAESEKHITQNQRDARVLEIRRHAEDAFNNNTFDQCLLILEEGLDLSPADSTLLSLRQRAEAASEGSARAHPTIPQPSFSTMPQPAYPAAPRAIAEESVGVTQLRAIPAPTGFFQETVVSRTRFFEGDQVRYTKIQETLKFYRDHLNCEYVSLSDQAKFTYYLWIASVSLGLAALTSGVVLLFMGQFRAGSITTISTAFVYFIQKVFQQREDHYRNLAAAKQGVLEYGNHWLLVIQSIDAIGDPRERERRQSELVDVLTRRLDTAKGEQGQPHRPPVARRKKTTAASL